MTEREFLDRYNPADFPPVAIAVDLVALSVINGSLTALLKKRKDHPAKGLWALPGSILQPQETLTDCAQRTLREKTALPGASLVQFEAFSAIDRDPRMRVVSIGFLALVAPATLQAAAMTEDLMLAIVSPVPDGLTITDPEGVGIQLAFDHADILKAALHRLRADLDRTTTVFGLLPDEFTLRDLQYAHEAIRGEKVNKPAFRKRMIDSGRLMGTGRRDAGTAFRPAELYRLREGAE